MSEEKKMESPPRRYARERLRVRKPTPEEFQQLLKMALDVHLRLRQQLRAKIILKMLERPGLSAGVAGVAVGYETRVPGSYWVKRFNELGIPGLEDLPRPGPSQAFLEEKRAKRREKEEQKIKARKQSTAS